MKTLDLPEGNAFGADESDSATPYVEDVEQRAQTLFFVWVTLTEHKWVIFGERRGLTAVFGMGTGGTPSLGSPKRSS